MEYYFFSEQITSVREDYPNLREIGEYTVSDLRGIGDFAILNLREFGK